MKSSYILQLRFCAPLLKKSTNRLARHKDNYQYYLLGRVLQFSNSNSIGNLRAVGLLVARLVLLCASLLNQGPFLSSLKLFSVRLIVTQRLA